MQKRANRDLNGSERGCGLLVNLLILTSQLANVFAGGDPDEMLCSRAWRLRSNWFWGAVCWVFDNIPPLSLWKGDYLYHCEACYWEERKRLLERLDDYTGG